MATYIDLSKYPRKFLAMTGHTVEGFVTLLPYFRLRFEKYVEAHTTKGKPRAKRRYTIYKNALLPTIEDKLLFILIYLKQQGITQEAHATLFGMYQLDANVWIHLLHPILNQALDDVGELLVQGTDAFDSKRKNSIYPVWMTTYFTNNCWELMGIDLSRYGDEKDAATI
ncbi:MAG: transposase family protein [Chloroflexota bacterium]|nr:transposase family protein [Chloroflexota bacterium]